MSFALLPAALFLNFGLVAAFIGGVLLTQLWLIPFVMRRIAKPIATQRPVVAVVVSSIAIALGAQWVPTIWLVAWVSTGNEVALFTGAFSICAGAILGMTYLAAVPAWLIAQILPGALLWLGFAFQRMSGPAPWVVFFAETTMALLIAASWKDRNALIFAAENHARQRAEADQANFEKSRFLATMSHELRTPLNAVIGYAEILEEDLVANQQDENAADAARIRRSAKSLLNLINEVLDFSKIEAGKLEINPSPESVSDLIFQAVEACSHLAAANRNSLTIKIDKEVPSVLVDAQRLKQCAINLISNACKFTQSGSVVVEADWLPVDGGRLFLSVTDTGRGISEDAAKKLFEPFVQLENSTTRTQGGSGLGLAITRRLAKLMGGDVSLTSQVSVGSRFSLNVSAPSCEHHAENVEAADTILVIDDDPAQQDLFRRATKDLPYKVLFASTAAQGLSAARKFKPALIIVDIHLPDRDGWSLIKELKELVDIEPIPVVVISMDSDWRRSLQRGADEHLVKPVERTKLLATLARHTKGAASDDASAHSRQAKALRK